MLRHMNLMPRNRARPTPVRDWDRLVINWHVWSKGTTIYMFISIYIVSLTPRIMSMISNKKYFVNKILAALTMTAKIQLRERQYALYKTY